MGRRSGPRPLQPGRRLSVGLAVSAGLLLFSVSAGAVAPPVERWESEAGAAVYYVGADELPMVDVRILFQAGSVRDGDHPGLAQLTARTVDEATAEWDAGTLGRRLEDAGARLSASAMRETAYLHLRSLTEPAALETALETFAAVLAEPAFPEDAVARELARMRQALLAQQQSADAVAERELYRALYGDHPYASPPDGTEASLGELDRERVAAFYREYYVAANAAVVIVGDVSRDDARRLADRLLAALPRGARAAPLPEIPPLPAEREVRIDFPAAQTAIYLAVPALARGDELEIPLQVANQVLGGSGLVSRLFQEMREDRGLSYSSHSGLRPGSVPGPWLVRSLVRADRTEEALAVMLGELERLAAEGLDDEEITEAVRHLTGAYPLSLAGNAAMVGQLSVLAVHDLPADHLAQYIPRMEAVDRAAVGAALDRVLDLERLTRVVVGPGVEDGAR